MRKITKFASALLFTAAALLSCQKENLSEVSAFDAPTSFTASFESTKLTIDGFKPKFEVGDVLGVTANNNATASFEVTEVDGAGVATLKIKGSWSASPTAPFFVYNGTPSVVVPGANILAFNAPNNVLSAEPNSISLSTIVAKTDALDNVMMLNASCLLKVAVPEGVKALKVAPVSGNIITTGSINLSGAINVGSMSASPVQVAFTGNNGAGLTAGTYYIPLFPQTFTGGVRVGVTTDGNEYNWKEKSGNFIFQRNKIYDLGNIADWFAPEPKFVVEDLVGTLVGDMKIGMESNGTFQANPVSGAENEVVASDNADKGNVKFTKFINVDNAFYANFDLVVGTVTIPAGETVKYGAYDSVTLTSDLVLSFDEETKTKLSLAAHTVLGPHPALGAYGFNVASDPFVLVKQTPEPPAPAGPAVADFVGTFKGQYKANYNLNPNAISDVADVEFVFEEADQDGCNVKLVSVGGFASGALGTLDVETGLLTFASGQPLPYPDNYALTAAKPLGDALQLQFSADRNSITMANSTCLINAMTYPSFCPQILVISLNRVGGSASEGFAITDLTAHSYSVSCKINGNTYAGTMTAVTTAAPGANLYLTNVFGTANGFGSDAYVTFNVETGELVFSTASATNRCTLPFGFDTYHTNTAMGDNILVMSADKKTITIPDDLGMLILYDASDNMVTVSDYTATLVE